MALATPLATPPAAPTPLAIIGINASTKKVKFEIHMANRKVTTCI